MKILVLGGYGTFGARLARLLADDRRLKLLIAGRSRDKAAALCADLPAGAQRQPLAFDRDGDVAAQVARAAPDLIVDASGPFQSYGGDPYRVVKAALAQGIDYLDLADGAAFVAGIRQFDGAAKARNIFLLSGVSSYPVLTAAVVRRLARDMARVESIVGGIAPSPDPVAVGPNVMRAIAAYAGKPTVFVRGGRRVTGHALTDARRYTIAPPGRLPLASRRFSLVDVPDLEVLPALWPEASEVWLGAGPVPAILFRVLNGLSVLVRLGLIPSLSPFADLFHRVHKRLSWGEHRGGMFIAVTGITPTGERIERSWHLLAEGDDGPFIPSMAAAAMIGHCLDGRRPAAGARPAATDLELADYEPLFARRTIVTGERETTPDSGRLPLYRRLLGAAWEDLPAPLRVMHDLQDRCSAEGRATVERGSGVIARAVAALFGFPKPGRDVSLRVELVAGEGRETWRRIFAGRSFASSLSAGAGKSDRLVVERFGPIRFAFALVLDCGRLRMLLRRWSLFGLPLPLWLAPAGEAYEHAAADRFNFHVEIGHPLTGLIVRYRGWLVPVPRAPA